MPTQSPAMAGIHITDIESAINHYTLTDGKDKRLYEAAKKLADCWAANLGPGKRAWFDGHQEMEQALADEGTTILKFFLHISKEEQKRRLQARLDDREKLWKFSLGDLAEREHWESYMEAYEEAIEQTSSEDAPWYVIPADKKWYRDLVISQIIVDTLERLDMKYPKPASGLDSVAIPD